MGADRRLVKWPQVVSYYQRLAAESPAVRLEELGPSTEDRPFLLATISSPRNLARLDEFRDIQRRLADPRTTAATEAEELIARGKAIVLITCSIHSTEVASTLTAMEFVYKLVTEDTPRHRRILDDTVFLLIPSLNPDGVDKVADWYGRWVGTRYEGAPMTELYQRYVGHDNNRDWYIFSQQETRLTVERVHNVWRPQIVYDVHQMGSTGARMFVPPWVDPIDPNVDPLIAQQANAFGMQMAADLTAEGLQGVVVNGIYDFFTPARHYQSYHGGVRLLSESAGTRYASPITVPFSALQTQGRGYNAQQSSWNFLEPWEGGRWSLRDIVDYQLVAFESVLYNAALKRADLLRNYYRIGRRILSRRSPAGFLLYRRQHDPNALTRLLQTLEYGMVEIRRASQDFFAAGEQVHEGDYVISMNQPYASFAKTLLEKQDYPDLREYPGGPPRRPYDVTAHSLPLLMGVEVKMLSGGLADATLADVEQVVDAPGRVADSPVLSLSPAYSHTWIAINRLLAMDAEVYRDETNGRFFVRNTQTTRAAIERLARELGVDFTVAPEDLSAYRRLRAPRVGLYAGFVPIMDEGWTRWVLEQYEFQFARLDNARIAEGGLREDFDVVILPDAEPQTLHAGYVEDASYEGAKVPPAYTGGIEDAGAAELRRFVQEGGTVLAFNAAATYAIERLGAPVENILDGVGAGRFYAPGALLRAEVETSHPLTFGMRAEEAVWFESGPAFRRPRRQEGPSPRVVLRYPSVDVLASGWLLGEEFIANRGAVVDVPLGKGHIVLFGIRPQYRAQPNATFKLVFNGLYYWSD